jgi:hypothetical protein
MFSQLSTHPYGRLGSIYKPREETSHWSRNRRFCHAPDAQVVLIGRVRSSRPLEHARADRTLPCVRHMPPDTSSRICATLKPLWTRSDVAASASDHLLCAVSGHQWSVAAMVNSASTGAFGACYCAASGAHSVWADCYSVSTDASGALHFAASGAFVAASGQPCRVRFFAISCPSWFLSSCLNFAWFIGSSIMLLASCLRCWSSDHHVAFV